MKARGDSAMADFCSQCSTKVFGEDFGDLKGLCAEGYWILVLCEGCGPIQVDHTGKCMSKDCLHRHGEQDG